MVFLRLLRSLLLIEIIYLTMPASFADTQKMQPLSSPIVSLQNEGKIQGYFDSNLAIFKGIPYAAPPINSYRWLPPQPVREWQGIRKTTEFAPMCSQKPNSWDKDPSFQKTNEDCLYLNIWAPESYFSNFNNQHSFPVMIWIHGGGFVSGGSSLPVYDPSELAKQGVIVVSFNYRLGRFGFFAHPALNSESEEDKSANYGLMDQIAVLKWVQNNIPSFGGDSNNVTIFGESAGGASILSLMTIPEAKGLFNKAIIQSGTGHTRAFPPTPKDKAEIIGDHFAQKHQISGKSVETAKQLRSLSTDDIVDDLNIQNLQPDFFSGLIIDQTLLTQSLDKAYEKGNFYPVPLMIGDNDGDGVLLSKITLSDLNKELDTTSDEINHIYNPDRKKSETNIVRQLIADIQFLEPTRKLTREFIKKNIPVYRYRFSYIADTARSYSSFGAPHFSEVPFVFNTLNRVYQSVSNQDRAMGKAMMTSWVNFAKNGNPSVTGFPNFLTVNQAPQQLIHYTMSGIRFENDPFQNRLDFIESLFNRKANKAKTSTQNIPIKAN
ncbi:carboxylesterase/lipase family protein [Commensalibacter nepenthis]|uniref:Carboxylic ester hydrolase n=1 Tax=Commensalibacter nepenthis TaxID=3043872 RepID=A0ABT6Q4T2_9PROT|nr:carboxylesterase family protein [Commensalibacter sp. TBRC 10068]MDI2111908.1 carboxylesterase family protein [Commensalibacter sp. TBRC 10068]